VADREALAARLRRLIRHYSPVDVPIPEVPAFADAAIVEHPSTGRECLLATSEDGDRLAFGFEVEGDVPGLELVDPALWLAGAEASEAVDEARADDWLQALVAHPVAAEWLGRIKQAHPEAYHDWFAQIDYEDGGEAGGG
jgi:hypothetical protein